MCDVGVCWAAGWWLVIWFWGIRMECCHAYQGIAWSHPARHYTALTAELGGGNIRQSGQTLTIICLLYSRNISVVGILVFSISQGHTFPLNAL